MNESDTENVKNVEKKRAFHWIVHNKKKPDFFYRIKSQRRFVSNLRKDMYFQGSFECVDIQKVHKFQENSVAIGKRAFTHTRIQRKIQRKNGLVCHLLPCEAASNSIFETIT